ncbi:nucleotide exchange factor GrpE [Actinokineospora sp. 24-640]
MATWFKGKRKDEATQQVEARVVAAPEYAPPPAVDPLVEQLSAERRAMVALCLYAHDRARSSGVAERIEEGLAGVGVLALRPDGQHFDPAVHEAGGTADTDDPALDGTVAETEVVGFSDRGQVLRPPIVTVYKAPTA